MWPDKMLSDEPRDTLSAMWTREPLTGNVIATKLRHLNAHATEALRSSGDGQQQGMSAWSPAAISAVLTEMVGEALAGAKATEIAIKMAENSRADAMRNYPTPSTEGQYGLT